MELNIWYEYDMFKYSSILICMDMADKGFGVWDTRTQKFSATHTYSDAAFGHCPLEIKVKPPFCLKISKTY